LAREKNVLAEEAHLPASPEDPRECKGTEKNRFCGYKKLSLSTRTEGAVTDTSILGKRKKQDHPNQKPAIPWTGYYGGRKLKRIKEGTKGTGGQR